MDHRVTAGAAQERAIPTARRGAAADPRAWLVWVAAAAWLAMITRNPLYLVLLIVIARLVTAAHGRAAAPLALPFWRISALTLTVATLFNALFFHAGATEVAHLPDAWPLVGGAITLEAALLGLSNGLLLIALLATFLALNAIVSVAALVDLFPRALREVAVIVLIAITYIPQTARHLRRIREAQAIRGHRVRGLRDWRPLLLPLVIGGLEQSLALAEAMVARGFGATVDRRQRPAIRLGLLSCLLIALAGWALSFWWPPAGRALLVAAVGALAILLWINGRRYRRTRYRARRWVWGDAIVMLAGLAPLVALAPGWLRGGTALGYNPMPAFTWPAFALGTALALLALALPILWAPRTAV